MRLVAFITQTSVIGEILTHLRTRAFREAHAGPRSPHRRAPPRAAARRAPHARPPRPRPLVSLAPPTPRDPAGTFGVRGSPTGTSDGAPQVRPPTVTAVPTAPEAHERVGGPADAPQSVLARSGISPSLDG